VNGWQDDFDTADERRAALWAAREARQRRVELWASAPDDARHSGTDKGMHHWPQIINRPRCIGCGSPYCEPDANAGDGEDPLDIVGRQAIDPLTAYERGRAQAGIEMRAAQLEMMRVRFSVANPEDDW
jgi:hypothetical protein